MAKTAVVPLDVGAVPAYLRKALEGKKNDDLYHAGGLPSLSFRGKVWRYSIKGEEVDVVDADDNPQATVDVVILKANARASKRYYPGKYVEGSTDAPACRSLDGISPDPDIAEPVSASCITCKKNIVGSKITEDNKRVKACQDQRRVAVIPADFSQDIPPLLLTLPPTSVWDRDNEANEAKGWFALAQYGDFLNKKGPHYQLGVTRIGFDARKSFPKLLFKWVRWLTQEEFERVQELSESQEVRDLLTRPDSTLAPAPQPEPAPEPAPERAKPATKPAARAATKKDDDDAPPAVVEDNDGDDAPPGAAPPRATKPRAKATVVAASDDLEAQIEQVLGTSDD